MIKKRSKLGWFLRWYYSHLLFAAQYVSFKDAGLEELFWNIVTWYHFFRHFEEFTCKIQWYVSKDIVAYIYIRDLLIGQRKPFISTISRVRWYRYQKLSTVTNR